MNITELDEFQGLTAEMVREWLLANQWEPCGSSAAHLYYQCGSGEISEALLREDLGWVVDLLAQSYERSVQSILREINPRMRKGMPSEAARKACPFWLVRDIETGEVELHRTEGAALYSASDYKSGALKTEAVALRDFGDWMEFWPCDANGNKVQWPTDAEGNML